MITRAAIVAEARTWLGTPYRHQGCRKGQAADCLGLVRGVAEALALAPGWNPDGSAERAALVYSRFPDPLRMGTALRTWLTPIPVLAVEPADVVWIAWRREPQHLALRTDRGLLHAYSGAGQVVEHALDARWQSLIMAAFRWPVLRET